MNFFTVSSVKTSCIKNCRKYGNRNYQLCLCRTFVLCSLKWHHWCFLQLLSEIRDQLASRDPRSTQSSPSRSKHSRKHAKAKGRKSRTRRAVLSADERLWFWLYFACPPSQTRIDLKHTQKQWDPHPMFYTWYALWWTLSYFSTLATFFLPQEPCKNFYRECQLRPGSKFVFYKDHGQSWPIRRQAFGPKTSISIWNHPQFLVTRINLKEVIRCSSRLFCVQTSCLLRHCVCEGL